MENTEMFKLSNGIKKFEIKKKKTKCQAIKQNTNLKLYKYEIIIYKI